MEAGRKDSHAPPMASSIACGLAWATRSGSTGHRAKPQAKICGVLHEAAGGGVTDGTRPATAAAPPFATNATCGSHSSLQRLPWHGRAPRAATPSRVASRRGGGSDPRDGLDPRGETPSSKKKFDARPSGEAKKNRPVELEEARGPRRPEGGEVRKGNTQQQQEKAKAKRLVRWKCTSGCGACCKLDKGPDFPTPDEIFADHPNDLQLYRSMISADGWCINYDKATCTCNIYQDRPSFCSVEPKVFGEFFGVPRSRFDGEACSACVDNIKMVYGDDSAELSNFKRVIREESNKLESKNQDKLLDA